MGGGEDSIDGAAEGGFAGGGEDGAVLPVLKEEAGDVVADFEAGDRGADGGDDSSGVGAGDAGKGHFGVVGAVDDHEVAVVEAGGVEVDEDFCGAGVGELEGVKGEMV